MLGTSGGLEVGAFRVMLDVARPGERQGGLHLGERLHSERQRYVLAPSLGSSRVGAAGWTYSFSTLRVGASSDSRVFGMPQGAQQTCRV